MASLMEDLFTALSGEKEIYEKLIPVSEKKTEILTRGDLKELEEVTREEQALVEKATAIGKKREEVIANIGVVLNRECEHIGSDNIGNAVRKAAWRKKKDSTAS